MTEHKSYKNIVTYAFLCALAAWGALVAFYFLREHPLSVGQVWRATLSFRLPPPTSFSKIILALKHCVLACLFVVVGILAGMRILGMVGARGSERRSGDKWLIMQDLMLALGLGWGLLMYMVFLLGVIGALYKAVILAVLVLLVLVCLREIPTLCRDVKTLFSPGKSEERSILTGLGATLLAIMLFLLLIIALAPTITHDAMVYHLNVPKIYANEHRIVEIPYNLFSNTVLNLGMLYTAALLIDEFILANLLHFVFGLGVLAFLYATARRNFGKTTAMLAVLILLFNPAVLNEMPIAYVDMGMAFYFLLCIYCLWQWRKEGDARWFGLLCVYAGIFAGIKYTSLHGLVAICVMIVATAFFSRERRTGRAIGAAAIFGAVVTLFVAPYLVKNYLMTGNPVYPLMYGIFDGRWLEPRQVERMLAYVNMHGMGHDWRNLLALPWNITIHGHPGYATFDMVITPLWLILLPAFVFIRHKSPMLKWGALACAVYFLSWAASTHITRYLMPIFPLLSLLCAHAVVSLTKEAGESSRPISQAFGAVLVSLCALIWFSFAYSYPLRVPPEFGPVMWGEQTTDEFQAKRIPNYLVFKYINENLPPDARLAFFWDNRGFFCERKQMGDSVFEAPSMMELVHEAGSAEIFREKLKTMGITHVLFNRFFFARFPVHTVSAEDDARLTNDFRAFQDFLSRYCVPLFAADDATLYELHG